MAVARQSLQLLNKRFRNGQLIRYFLYITNYKYFFLSFDKKEKEVSCLRFPVKTLIATRGQDLKLRACEIDNRMFSTSNILSKEQIEELQKNPFFDKYAEKIAKLQKYLAKCNAGLVKPIFFFQAKS